MLTNRSSGILLHPSSLPGPFGSGDFGADAYRFVDWLQGAGQRCWQLLPLGEIGPGNSPYMSNSAFAGNIFMIDLADLAEQGWLGQEDLIPHPDFQVARVDYTLIKKFRSERLRRAAKVFFATFDAQSLRADYEIFCQEESYWLEDYALFRTLEDKHQGCGWSHWSDGFPSRESLALQHIAASCTDDMNYWKFCQWSFMRQWLKLKKYAAQRGIIMIGDVPIFVAYQSADVWANQALFELDETGHPTVVAGVPPDYFSATGQLWGNPLYRWNMHEQTGYSWWVSRMRHALKLFDVVRIDHFRGFASYWEIPACAPTAMHGRWVAGPGEKLFKACKQALGELPIIAEDLGVITPDVEELRDKFGLPGMRVLQFAFGEDESNYFLPHHYIPNAVAYSGTHDNDTTIGWWEALIPQQREFVQRYLASDGQEIHWDMIKALSRSSANTVIFSMQDVLGLSGDHRMNYPGQALGNWEWRFSWSQLLPEQTRRLAQLSDENGRIVAG